MAEKIIKSDYRIFLDDIRTPENAWNYMKNPIYLKLDWEIVRNFKEFVQIIEDRGIPAMVSYDHDLADIHYKPDFLKGKYTEFFEYHEETGEDCAKHLIKKLEGAEHPDWWVHSANPVGAERIRNVIKDYENKKDTE